MNNLSRAALVLTAGLLAGAPARAMTETEAAANVMYFAFAARESELCETLGYPGGALFKLWERANAGVYVASMRRIEDHAMATLKVSPDEARQTSASLVLRLKARYDKEIAPIVTGKSCSRFGETMRLYASKLVRD